MAQWLNGNVVVLCLSFFGFAVGLLWGGGGGVLGFLCFCVFYFFVWGLFAGFSLHFCLSVCFVLYCLGFWGCFCFVLGGGGY